jgi:hypothetical protein
MEPIKAGTQTTAPRIITTTSPELGLEGEHGEFVKLGQAVRKDTTANSMIVTAKIANRINEVFPADLLVRFMSRVIGISTLSVSFHLYFQKKPLDICVSCCK